MYIVIAGNSVFAEELAKLLMKEEENKVVLIVKKKEEALRISQEVPAIVINADVSDTNAFDELNLAKCDAFVSATDSEKDNILSAIYAKNAGAKKIFVVTDGNESQKMLEKLDFVPISAESFAARAVELMISRPAVSDLVNIGIGEFDIIEVEAAKTRLVGKEIGEAKGVCYNAIATYLNGKYDFSKSRKIIPEDVLVLIVSAGKEKNAEKEFRLTTKQKMGFMGKKNNADKKNRMPAQA